MAIGDECRQGLGTFGGTGGTMAGCGCDSGDKSRSQHNVLQFQHIKMVWPEVQVICWGIRSSE